MRPAPAIISTMLTESLVSEAVRILSLKMNSWASSSTVPVYNRIPAEIESKMPVT